MLRLRALCLTSNRPMEQSVPLLLSAARQRDLVAKNGHL
jgi:hypothetical protein